MAKSRMASILAADQKRAQRKRDSGRTEGLAAQISNEAVMSAVMHEGKYIMGEEGRGYWRDMERRYPHLNLLKHKDTGDSPNGHYNRHGKVTKRFIPGKGWFTYKGGEMVAL
jgi:hypothetical protein